MKKTFKFFAAALAIVAAASCAKEINVDTPADDSADKVQMTFTASYDAEGETKTVLADGNMVHWSDTDAIRIFGKKDGDSELYISDEAFAIDPSSNDSDPTYAVFSGTGVPYSKNYAVLPANGWGKYNSYMRFTEGLGQQTAVKNSFDPSKHIAISSETTGNHFDFYNECALLKVKIGSDGVYSVKVDGKTGAATTGVDNIGIGMQLQYTPGKVGKLSMNHVAGLSSSIILANSDPSKALESGATYYIVVPYAKFAGFKVAICDANGNEIFSKTKASKFTIERNKVYDLGTFEKPNESVEINATSLSFDAAGGSTSFNVVANVNWTVTSNADWLTVSPSTGSTTTGTAVTVTASANTSTSDRTATITIKGSTISKTISVTQAKPKTFNRVKQLDKAGNIQGGVYYIIRLHNSGADVLTVSNDKLVLTDNSAGANYTEDNVFIFVPTGSASGPAANYKSMKAGRFQSLKTGKYISVDLGLTDQVSQVQTFCLASNWDSATTKDIDIYKNGTSNNRLHGNKDSHTVYWSTSDDNTTKKWGIYEVKQN